MTSKTFGAASRRALFGAASAAAVLATAGVSFAQVELQDGQAVPGGAQDEATDQIVTHHQVTPGTGSSATGANYANSAQVLDPRNQVNGVGQQIVFSQSSSTGAGLGLCTGTLINPRTVITAAHCLNTRPAHMYGSQTGSSGGTYGAIATIYGQTQGVPISFGFSALNRGCADANYNIIACPTGQKGPYETWRDGGFRTNTAFNIYNGNQVWYHPNLNATGEFANGDIALVTLDTHAKGIPTWTLLFSPLDGPTHVTITGYGGTGVGLSGIGSLAGIDYRRRSAENMIDALMSWHDQNTMPAISGPKSTARIVHQHALYWMDFDDPTWNPNNLPANFFKNTAGTGRNNGYYDFNVLGGPTGTALPFEGTTAGGDSGGPLIVDRRWDKKVVAGVLTGSISYNGGISTYGQMNVYPPLFLFWEDIVRNNPYVYASAKAGNGDWFDPTHWVQDMDPNYAVIGSNGELLNGVPDTNQGGADGAVAKFGTVCYLNQNCADATGPGNPVGNGEMIVTAGGPGSTNFVPNNVEPVNSADPTLHKKARYYDVTLRERGITTMGGAATIDMLTLNGPAKLDVTTTGDLKVLSDFNQLEGWTNVDGKLTTGEALMATGLFSGTGTFKAPFLTTGLVSIAPGGADRIGTLTVDGNLVMSSATSLFIDAARGGADKLAVTGAAGLGGTLVFNKPADAPAPRHGETYTILSAGGGVVGTFNSTIFSFQGVLRPELTYTANSVEALLRAGSFVEMLEGATSTQLAFAQTLDTLRSGSYSALYNLYGGIDLMDARSLAATFNRLAPTGLNGSLSLYDMQTADMSDMFNARLSLLGRSDAPQGLSVGAGLSRVLAFGSDTLRGGAGGVGNKPTLGLTSDSTMVQVAKLPEGVSAFVTGGYSEDRASATVGAQALTADEGGKSWHMAAGVENRVNERLTLGVATAYAKGQSAYNGLASTAENELMQSAVYGAYRFDHGVYVAGLAGAGVNKSDTRRRFGAGLDPYDLKGELQGTSLNASLEAGMNVNVARGLTLTPKAGLRWSQLATDGFSEFGGDAALAVDGRTIERAEGRLGLALAGSTRRAGWTIMPQLEASLVQNLSGDDAGVTVRFAGADGHSFYLPGMERDSNWGEVRGGLRLQRDQLGFGLDISSSVQREELHEDRVAASVSLKF